MHAVAPVVIVIAVADVGSHLNEESVAGTIMTQQVIHNVDLRTCSTHMKSATCLICRECWEGEAATVEVHIHPSTAIDPDASVVVIVLAINSANVAGDKA